MLLKFAAEDAERVDTTRKLLRVIALHLSSREECRKVEYRLTINEDTSVTFYPDTYVYTSIYKRKPADKFHILEHIMKFHLPQLRTEGTALLGELHMDVTQLVCGTYVYQSSFDHKKRKWTRIQ